jgi:hypothetical protein
MLQHPHSVAMLPKHYLHLPEMSIAVPTKWYLLMNLLRPLVHSPKIQQGYRPQEAVATQQSYLSLFLCFDQVQPYKP